VNTRIRFRARAAFFKVRDDEKGNVESAMVLIPLLLTFLIGFQIASTTHLRNISRVTAQDAASQRGISGEFLPSDEFVHIDSSGDGQNLDLVVTRERREVPWFLPGSSQIAQPGQLEVSGIAMVENQR
jgi:hypothetical protein